MSTATDTIREEVEDVVERLNKLTKRFKAFSAKSTARALALARPLDGVLKKFKETGRKRYIELWEEDPSQFTRVDKTSSIREEGFDVGVQERESAIEKEGALEWLRKNKPRTLIPKVTQRVCKFSDTEAFTVVLHDLERAVRKKEKTDALVAELLGYAKTRLVLDQKLVEKAVKAGALTDKDVGHMYEIKKTNALVFNKPKDVEAEE